VNKTNFTLYPNPVQSNIIYFNTNNPSKIEVYTITGKLILSKNLKNDAESLDVSGLNQGLYLVKMTTNFGVQVKKLIRQ
jgi:hypothetical protein